MNNNLFNNVPEIQNILFGDHNMYGLRDNIRSCVLDHKAPLGPKILMTKVSNRCNSNCAYCAHAYARDSEEKNDLRHDIIMRTIREAGRLGVAAMTLTGGEPLIRRDIEEFVSALREEKVTPVLLTNGLLLPDRWKTLGEAGLRYIIMSMDSLEPETYNKQRGAKFSDALAGLDAAVMLKDRYPGTHIHITVVLTKNNAHEIPAFVEYMSSRGVYVQINPYHHYNPTVPNELRISDPETAFALTGALLRMKREGKLISNSDAFLAHIPDFFLKQQNIPQGYHCLTGFMGSFIDAYGNVRCCWDAGFEPIGNLYQNTFTEIWNSEAYRIAREQQFNTDCSGCWYLCTGEITTFAMNAEY